MTNEQLSVVGFLTVLLVPLILVLGGAGLAAVGLTQGSLLLMVLGVILAGIGVLWAFVRLEVANPFDWF